MSKILAILGATGQQGGALLSYVLNDPELFQKYKIRAITRDVGSEKAKQLKEKVEVVQGDVQDKASLAKAFTGVNTVFAMTTPIFSPDGLEAEYNIGKAIADVAVERGVEYIIWSTLPGYSEMSGGKYSKVTPFDAKAKVEQYIRGLPIKSAFYSGAFFMENFEGQPFLAPRKASDGTWVLARNISSKTPFPYIDTLGDSGKFIGAILAEPDKYEGKLLCAAAGFYTLDEIAAILTKTTGQTVVYKQISDGEFKQSLGFLPELFSDAFKFLEEYGYFGPGSEELVAWAVKQTRGRLTTLPEYLEAHPPRLE